MYKCLPEGYACLSVWFILSMVHLFGSFLQLWTKRIGWQSNHIHSWRQTYNVRTYLIDCTFIHMWYYAYYCKPFRETFRTTSKFTLYEVYNSIIGVNTKVKPGFIQIYHNYVMIFYKRTYLYASEVFMFKHSCNLYLFVDVVIQIFLLSDSLS